MTFKTIFYKNFLKNQNKQKGFTAVEILISLSILLILTSVAVISFNSFRYKSKVDSEAKNLIFNLESTKANALSGKNGINHGVAFYNNRYIKFQANNINDFVENDPNNEVVNLDSELELTHSILSGNNAIIFSRINGSINNTATITISHIQKPEIQKNILIENLGDISLQEE